MMLKRKLARPAVLVLAGVVAALTFAVVVHAVQTITVPNASLVSYNLAAGQISPAITVPVAEQPVLVMGTCTTVGTRGVGHVSLLRVNVAPAFLEWVGLNSTAGATIAQGFSAVAGTLIIFVDFAHQVRIEVAGPAQILVRNASAAPRTGNVKMIW
jgi:hypothetical protein